jgi:hypothetical protein
MTIAIVVFALRRVELDRNFRVVEIDDESLGDE